MMYEDKPSGGKEAAPQAPAALHFGKHNGRPVSEIPSDSLQWVLREVGQRCPKISSGTRRPAVRQGGLDSRMLIKVNQTGIKRGQALRAALTHYPPQKFGSRGAARQ